MWSSLPPFPPGEDLPLEEDVSKINTTNHDRKELPPKQHENNQSANRIRNKPTARRSFSSDIIPPKSAAKIAGNNKRRPLIGDLRRRHTETQRDETFDSLSNDFESLLKEIKADSSCLEDDNAAGATSRWYTTQDNGIDYSLPSHLPPTQNNNQTSLLTQKMEDEDSSLVTCDLPPPDRLGYGNPFLLFLCLAVLREDRDVINEHRDYDEFAMIMHKKVRSHSPRKILSKAMKYFAEYLRTQRERSVS